MTSGFVVEGTLARVELSCATTTSGALFVMTFGGHLMLMWSAGSWDLLQQVLYMCFVINSALWFTFKWLETLEHFLGSHLHIIHFLRSHIDIICFSKSHIDIIRLSRSYIHIIRLYIHIIFFMYRCCTNQVCLLWPGNWSYSPGWCPVHWNWDTTDWLSC